MIYSIVGTGGIGGYYGARLAAAGEDVNFLARSDYHAMKENGLEVKSVKGDILLREVSVFNDATMMPKADVILVCIKTTGNASLPSIIRPMLKSDTMVVLIQNGLGMEEKLHEQLPGVSIAGATAFICSSKVGHGKISHTAYGELTIALLDSGDAAAAGRIDEVGKDLEEAGVPCHIAPSLPLMRWKKLVWNIPYNGLSVVKDAKTDYLTFDPECRKLVIAMMKEVQAGAASCGCVIEDEFIDRMIDMTEKMFPYYPSMYLDWAAGRKMEIETMYESPYLAAKSHGCDMPLTKSVMGCLKAKK